MIFLILGIAAGISVGVIFKLVGSRNVDRLTFITTNYAAAGLTAFAVLSIGGADLNVTSDRGLITFGAIGGIVYISGFMVFSWAVQVIGVAIVIGVLRTSIVLAFLASWLVWGEHPSGAQFFGMFMAVAAFFMISRLEKPATETTGPSRRMQFIVLAILFFNVGAVDISLKAFNEWFVDDFDLTVCAWLIFSSAAAYGVVTIAVRGLAKNRWPDLLSIQWGVLLGIVNFGSIDFLVRALDVLPGTFVLPVNGIVGTIGAALLGVMVWREHLSGLNWVGIGMAATALVLLNL